ncbi:MAG TPA: hypothetical protein VGK35_01910, partial [Actinotalea sp.]
MSTFDPQWATAAQAADPATPPEALAAIANERPELRPYLATNPATYPTLLAWLADLDDPMVTAALRSRRPAAPATPAAPGPAAPGMAQPYDAASYAPQARAWPEPRPEPQQQPEPPVVGGQTVFTPAALSPDLALSEPPRYADAATRPPAEFIPVTSEPFASPRRGRGARVAWWLGSAAVVLVAAGGVTAYSLVFSKLGGAHSPEDAVSRLLAAVEAKDPVAVYGLLAPDEIQGLKEIVEASAPEQSATASPVDTQALLDTLTITLEGQTLDVTQVDDGLARVEVSGGSMAIDADVDALSDLLNEMAASGLEAAGMPVPAADELRTMLDEALPASVDLADLVMTTPSGEKVAPFLMTVEIDGSWYVSPYMTVGEYAVTAAGLERAPMPATGTRAAYSTPEKAGAGLLDGLAAMFGSGDVEDLARTLAPAEHRFLTVYGAPLMTSGGAVPQATITIGDRTFVASTLSDDVALLTPETITAQVKAGPTDLSLEYGSGCASYTDNLTGETASQCLTDDPTFAAMQLDNPGLVALRSGDSWSVSIAGSLLHLVAQAASAYPALLEEGLVGG